LLHFAFLVVSIVGIVVMPLLVGEIINRLEHVLWQNCGVDL
jgi:fucose permease